ncbi:MAG: aminotransferase class I/II-fold pyridoxal phosphate-dependent enzyme [Ruminococcus sp.]|nr:aminotransferase class I/II-fold pyridoxal phosphate-dependent enzyme [Ruminococcus sp.]
MKINITDGQKERLLSKMYELNKKISNLKPYKAIEGNYKIRLDANESCFNLDETMLEEVSKAVSKVAFNRYPDWSAKEPIKAFANLYDLDENLITAGNGSDELISIIESCFLETGDTIVTLSNDFSMYAFYSSLYDTNVEIFQKEQDLTINVDKLIEFCIEKDARGLIFSNPCNPTSLGLVKEDVRKLLKSLPNCLIILDEAYMDFWKNQSMLGEIKDYDNCIILKTCSKALGLASIRMGFAIASEKITNALKSVKSPYNTDSVSQAIVTTVLSDRFYVDIHTNQIIENLQGFYLDILKLQEKYPNVLEKVYKSVTNFVFIKTSYDETIFNKMFEHSIAIRRFNGYIRINTGTKFENQEVLNALDEIISEL